MTQLIKVYSPRIHNLGDFSHCLPALSGIYKQHGIKMSFVICDRLQRFKGIKELLMHQEMFYDVKFMHEETHVPPKHIVIDDTGSDSNVGDESLVSRRFYNFIRTNYEGLNFDLDTEFELHVPNVTEGDLRDKILLGDRWSRAEDLDTRRNSSLLEKSDKFIGNDYEYLDYSKDLVYNCSLIKYNTKPFITTFTGIGILADLMKKDSYILYDDDFVEFVKINHNGKGVDYDHRQHYFQNRKTKLQHINDFKL